MPYPTITVAGGNDSQTGIATKKEFPTIQFNDNEESIGNIVNLLKDKDELAVLPMWNSHEGEIEKAHTLESIFNETSRLLHLWPSTIIFECIAKKGVKLGNINTIMSVYVAQRQCSKFIAKQKAIFIDGGLTNVSYEKFKVSKKVDAALCAPGQNVDGFKVINKNVSNPKNFTTFAFIGCKSSLNWKQEWGDLNEILFPKQGYYFGVRMPIRSVYSDAQETLLTALSNDVKRIDDIPKVLFVSQRTPSTCGLLIESNEKDWDFEIIEDEAYSDEIIFQPDLGETHSLYSSRILQFLDINFTKDMASDFIRHRGDNTVFYACPAIGIAIHGFEEKIVEPVVKRIISKYFQLYVNGIDCTKAQIKFFRRNLNAYKEQGRDFIEFVDIAL